MTTPPLSPSDVEHFVEFGFVKVEDCFDTSPGSKAAEWVERAWDRMALNPDDPSDWPGKMHLPTDEHVLVREFSPKAWAVVEQLCGRDRAHENYHWSDAFIMNLNFGADEPWVPPGSQAKGWHKDGDFFMHFLDSPEQALLTIVLWSDVVHQGGPTYIACDSIRPVAEYLNDNRGGVHPMNKDGRGFPIQQLMSQCSDFREATGKAGDVFFMHPFMLHASSQNMIGKPRFITNPPVKFREPMCFDRPDGDHSPVEQAVLRALGVERLDFQPEAPREAVVPNRLKMQKELLADAEQRRAAKQG